MLTKIFCPCTRKNPNYQNVKCRHYLGEVEGRYQLRCDRCKGVVEGDTSSGLMKIIHPAEK